MSPKYNALRDYLRDRDAEGELEIELTFEEVSSIVGGLPPSAYKHHAWWANDSKVEAVAIREAGWHVNSHSLSERRVRFALGRKGGSRLARTERGDSAGIADRTKVDAEPVEHMKDKPAISTLRMSIALSWLEIGPVSLDDDMKLKFPAMPAHPGLYRFNVSNPSGAIAAIYIGESINLRRRLHGNYRNPGPRQRTSLRVNQWLSGHLSSGLSVSVWALGHATVEDHGSVESSLDLSLKSNRLLVESAALLDARKTSAAIENL